MDDTIPGLGEKDCGGYYSSNKLAGNSPELCRALDSHGFSHFKRIVNYHVTISGIYADDNPKKFGFRRLGDMQSTMERCWTISPTSEEIVQDVEPFRKVVECIVHAKGALVPDDDIRRGRRAVSLYEKVGMKKTNLRNRDWRCTNEKRPPTHPELDDAMTIIHQKALQHPVNDLQSVACVLFGNESDTDTNRWSDHDD